MKLPALFVLSLLSLSVSAQERPLAVLSAPGGRFAFGQISSLARDQYMLDTQTGRLWQIVQSTNSTLVLQVVPYRTIDGFTTLAPKSAQQEQDDSYDNYLQERVSAAASFLLWLEANPKGGTYERGGQTRRYTEAEVKTELPKAKDEYERHAKLKEARAKEKLTP